MLQKPKREVAILIIYSDGTVHLQELHEATSIPVALDDDPSGGLGDGGGNNPPPPKDP